MNEQTSTPAASPEEAAAAAQIEKEQAEARFRRLRSAVTFELVAFLLTGALFIVFSLDFSQPPTIRLPIVQISVAGAILFLVIFGVILTGKTPLVYLATRLKADAATDIFLEIKPPPGPPEPRDDVERYFRTYIERSQAAKDAAQRRPTGLLFIGGGTAIVGIAFFIATLPGTSLGLIVDPTQGTRTQDLWAISLQLLPRLLMLVFIQVLAGFFLRQYRSAMEDFRYYESVLRHRESQYLSYILRRSLDDPKSMAKFADELLKERGFGVLTKGQTTTVIEAQRSEVNDVSTLYERLAALITACKA
jgi:hypothetical protein